MNGSHAPAPNRLAAQSRANVAAKEVGIKLHTMDVFLGRAPDRQWQQVPSDERDVYIQRGALALRLTDPVKVQVAVSDAAAAVFVTLERHAQARAQGRPCATTAELTTAVTTLATTRFIASLAGQR